MLVLASLATPVRAHDSGPPAPHDLWAVWQVDPLVLLGLGLAALLYARGLGVLWGRLGRGGGIAGWRVGAYAVGLATLGAALVSPLDALSTALLSAHMVQHLLLVLVAAPLLVLSDPLLAFLWALPLAWRRRLARAWHRAYLLRRGWRVLTAPLVVLALHTGALWVWHAPGLYQAALRQPPVHALEHAALLSSALLFWWLVASPRARHSVPHGVAVLLAFAAAMQSGILGALMTLARTPWYPAYAEPAAAWGLTALEDQQLAGAIMWVPGGLIYLLTTLALIAGWLQAAAGRACRREAQPAAHTAHGSLADAPGPRWRRAPRAEQPGPRSSVSLRPGRRVRAPVRRG